MSRLSEEAVASALGFDPNTNIGDALAEVSRRIRAEPEFGRHLLPSLLQLADSDSAETHEWFLRCAQAIVANWRGSDGDFIALCGVARRMLRSQVVAVVVHAVRLTTLMVPLAFRLCCRLESDATLWAEAEQLKMTAVEVAATAGNDGVHIQSVKLLGTLIATYTPCPTAELSLDLCPTAHPFLQREALSQEGSTALHTLLRWMSTVSNNTAAAILSVLGLLGRVRPQLISTMLTTLLEYYASPPSTWSTDRVRYYQKNLKVTLMSIFKNLSADVEYTNEVVNALTALGLEQEMALYQSRQARIVQRHAANAALVAEHARKNTVSVTMLAPSCAAQLATDALASTSALEFSQATANSALRQLTIEGISAEFPPRKKIRVSLRDPRHHDPRFADFVLTRAPSMATPFVASTLVPETTSDEPCNAAAVPSIAVKHELEEMALNQADVLSITHEKALGQLDDAEVLLDSVELAATSNITDEVVAQLCSECYVDILHGSSSHSIGLELWRYIAVRLATRGLGSCDDVSNERTNRLVAFIQGDIEDRQELALAWFYELWRSTDVATYAVHAEPLYSSAARWHISLSQQDRSLLVFTQNMPFVSDGMLAELSRLCSEFPQALAPVAALCGIVKQRPPVRQKALRMLLDLCVAESASVRATPIAELNEMLLDDSAMIATFVEEFAVNALQHIQHCGPDVEHLHTSSSAAVVAEDDADAFGSKLCKTDESTQPSAASEPSTEYVSRYADLFFALCPQRHALIAKLFDVYIQCSAAVQRVIRQQLHSPVKSIGMDSDELLDVLQTFPKGGETLALRILIILTDKVSPSPRLVKTVRGIYQRRSLDARFLIPIISGMEKREIFETLPKIIGLLNGTDHERKIVREVFLRILTVPQSSGSAAAFAPAVHSKPTTVELLVTLHCLDEDQVGVRKAAEAIQICLGEKQLFTAEVLMIALQQLVELPILPTLFMRTVIQALTMYETLNNLVHTLLHRLISRHVWTNATLWQGFIRCCKILAENSVDLLLQLPKAQLMEVCNKEPSLKQPLRAHVHAKRALLRASTIDAATAEESAASGIADVPDTKADSVHPSAVR